MKPFKFKEVIDSEATIIELAELHLNKDENCKLKHSNSLRLLNNLE